MGAYPFRVGHLRPVVAAVAVHGITDLDSWHWPLLYALFCFVPLPPHAVTALFVASSLVHFAEDVGIDGSLALHSLAGFLWLSVSAQRGIEFMMAYLVLVHTPAHYARCWRRRRWRERDSTADQKNQSWVHARSQRGAAARTGATNVTTAEAIAMTAETIAVDTATTAGAATAGRETRTPRQHLTAYTQ